MMKLLILTDATENDEGNLIYINPAMFVSCEIDKSRIYSKNIVTKVVTSAHSWSGVFWVAETPEEISKQLEALNNGT